MRVYSGNRKANSGEVNSEAGAIQRNIRMNPTMGKKIRKEERT